MFVKTIHIAVFMLSIIFSEIIQADSSFQAQEKYTLLELTKKRVVDLSQKFDIDIPHWFGFESATRKIIYKYKPDGFRVEEYCHVGQWGTHVDPPGHFFEGKRMLDDIKPSEMILPLVVIDVHKKVSHNPDYTLKVSDIKRWERKHGKIPKSSFVVMRTDWSKRWPSQEKMMNEDKKGIKHYPGWSIKALKYLYETRKITASGHETTDTDPGISTSKDDYTLEAYILEQDHYQIELLTNLDKVPEFGAIAVVTWPNIRNGSGFPARVLAIVP